MRDDLRQDGLSLVSKGIVRCLVSVCRELKRLLKLPLEVQLQTNWNLITGESVWFHKSLVVGEDLSTGEAVHAHVLRRHLKLIFAKCVESTQCDIGMGDTVLPGGEQLEIIATLQNRTIVRWNVQTGSLSVSTRVKKKKRNKSGGLTTTQRRNPLMRYSQDRWSRSSEPRGYDRESCP